MNDSFWKHNWPPFLIVGMMLVGVPAIMLIDRLIEPSRWQVREAEAVERGYAEYVPDPKTRQPIFRWLDKPKQLEAKP